MNTLSILSRHWTSSSTSPKVDKLILATTLSRLVGAASHWENGRLVPVSDCLCSRTRGELEVLWVRIQVHVGN